MKYIIDEAAKPYQVTLEQSFREVRKDVKHMRGRILITSLLILLLLPSCKVDGPVDPPIFRKSALVAIDPIQCMGNPWEREWLEEHEWELYPRELEDKLPIIVDYYQRQGFMISDSTILWTHNSVCLACSCPAGYTVYFLVSRRDVQMMLELGFRIESPEEALDP